MVDKRMTANLVFLRKSIEGCIDASSIISKVHSKVPPRFPRSRYPFVNPSRHTNYGKNNPIDPMMRLANEHPILFSL